MTSKVALYFDSQKIAGGSYQMAINNLLKLREKFLSNNKNLHIFLEKNNKDLDELKISYEIITLNIFDRVFLYLVNFLFFKLLINKLFLCSHFEKFFLKRNISLIIFLIPNYKQFLFQKIKMISTVLDVCHKEFPEFDELNSFQIFQFREKINREILPRSIIVVAESEVLKDKIIKFYNIESDRIVVISNIPSLLFADEIDNLFKESIIEKYNIKNFFFYPAQFWPHKNHILILSAIKILKEKYNKEVNFIFCGVDKKLHKFFLKNKIIDMGLEKNVKILDYLSHKEVQCILGLADALVMPTFLGPTNIPPTEAWGLRIPVLYSSLLKNHGKEAALYFDVFKAEELAIKIIELDAPDVKNLLVENGTKRLADIKKQNQIGVDVLYNKIMKFINLRNSWRA